MKYKVLTLFFLLTLLVPVQQSFGCKLLSMLRPQQQQVETVVVSEPVAIERRVIVQREVSRAPVVRRSFVQEEAPSVVSIPSPRVIVQPAPPVLLQQEPAQVDIQQTAPVQIQEEIQEPVGTERRIRIQQQRVRAVPSPRVRAACPNCT